VNHDEFEDWREKLEIKFIELYSRIEQLEEDMGFLMDTVIVLAERLDPDKNKPTEE
jgi:hypothetical protein